MITFALQGILPSGKNAVKNTRSGHRYPSKRFVDWRTQALTELQRQCDGIPQPVRYRMKMSVAYVPGDKRVRDVAGMTDALCHLLERSGLIENDGLIRDITWEELPLDRKNARAVIVLEEKV